MKELENELQNRGKEMSRIGSTEHKNSDHSRVSSFMNDEAKEYETTIAKLKFELANIKNYNHYLENIQNLQNQKY